MAIGTDYAHFSICKDVQEKLICVLVLDLPNSGTSLGLFMINIGTHEFYKIHIVSGEENYPDDETDLFIMTRKEDIEFKAFKVFEKLENIYVDAFQNTNSHSLHNPKM
ncbi:hypothetical protein RF11_13092 [Thelohanellus kitauei]|uniref:Uncharacterized protein n=1 Tax=Thelohanellus kitauei TaxID=669202 RepID=A0A0C2I5H3_THEKT|nr:hypothetical protein RF11_13092 [Thelohanellus kitauei]